MKLIQKQCKTLDNGLNFLSRIGVYPASLEIEINDVILFIYLVNLRNSSRTLPSIPSFVRGCQLVLYCYDMEKETEIDKIIDQPILSNAYDAICAKKILVGLTESPHAPDLQIEYTMGHWETYSLRIDSGHGLKKLLAKECSSLISNHEKERIRLIPSDQTLCLRTLGERLTPMKKKKFWIPGKKWDFFVNLGGGVSVKSARCRTCIGMDSFHCHREQNICVMVSQETGSWSNNPKLDHDSLTTLAKIVWLQEYVNKGFSEDNVFLQQLNSFEQYFRCPLTCNENSSKEHS